MDANELRDTIAEKTDLTMEQAKEAAAAVVQWIQENLPDDASDQVREFAASASDWAAQTLSSVGGAAADMLDKAEETGSGSSDEGADN
jgi:gas vesicle protein